MKTVNQRAREFQIDLSVALNAVLYAEIHKFINENPDAPRELAYAIGVQVTKFVWFSAVEGAKDAISGKVEPE